MSFNSYQDLNELIELIVKKVKNQSGNGDGMQLLFKKKEKRMNVFWFLLASFVSFFGDKLLVLAIPVGLGLEFNDIRSAIFMWLIPAMAMYLASHLTIHIKRRVGTARKDYARLLFFYQY